MPYDCACAECRALAEEFRSARIEQWEAMDPRIRDSIFSALKTLGEDSEKGEEARSKLRNFDAGDFSAVEEAFPKFKPALNPDRIDPQMNMSRVGRS